MLRISFLCGAKWRDVTWAGGGYGVDAGAGSGVPDVDFGVVGAATGCKKGGLPRAPSDSLCSEENLP